MYDKYGWLIEEDEDDIPEPEYLEDEGRDIRYAEERGWI